MSFLMDYQAEQDSRVERTEESTEKKRKCRGGSRK